MKCTIIFCNFIFIDYLGPLWWCAHDRSFFTREIYHYFLFQKRVSRSVWSTFYFILLNCHRSIHINTLEIKISLSRVKQQCLLTNFIFSWIFENCQYFKSSKVKFGRSIFSLTDSNFPLVFSPVFIIIQRYFKKILSLEIISIKISIDYFFKLLVKISTIDKFMLLIF